ncbi:hypothetical protein VE02_01735 [Pseudogymnoascus sp. 03VT05]|nr:hypothetical protein VE02_01735 [Pseudogymnoascus sp. 03VT05]
MAIRWRSQSVVLAVLVTFIFFFVLQNDRLRGGVSINPDDGSLGGTPAEAQFDEKMEEEFNKELDIFYGEVQKSRVPGAIYTPTLKNLETNATIMDQIRYPNALSPPAIKAPYSPVPARSYSPQYEIQDKNQWAVSHPAKFTHCGSPWSNFGISDNIQTFAGNPKGFPSPAFGDRDALDWEKYTCFDRQGRFGRYGYIEGKGESEIKPAINWETVNWGALQDHCLYKNVERFPMRRTEPGQNLKGLGWMSAMDRSHMKRSTQRRQDPAKGETPRPDPNRVPPPPVTNRTAVLIRARYDTIYRENDVLNIRALINELSFKTGGEYQVYLLVEIEDCDDATWTDKSLYDAAVAKSVPPEFSEMAHIYTERLLRSWYPAMPSKADVGGPVLEKMQWLPIQRFAHLNPSYAYFWNWDLNVRFTGHYYDLAKSLPRFAQRQPRKCMWERNERLATPSLDGPYETVFRDKVEKESDPEGIIWDVPVVPEFTQQGPRRPAAEEAKNEHFMWGLGEKADLITLFPIFNPVGTTWSGRNDVWGYKHGKNLARRATAGTFGIASKKLLDLMQKESLEGRFLNSEMAAPTVALLHGLKAVYAPQPIWFEHAWIGDGLRKYFNSGPRKEVGSSQKSLYGSGKRSMLWEGSTFDTNSKAAAKLWDKWMGVGVGAAEFEKKNGRMCLPPMLLFPVQDKSPVVWTYSPPAGTESPKN